MNAPHPGDTDVTFSSVAPKTSTPSPIYGQTLKSSVKHAKKSGAGEADKVSNNNRARSVLVVDDEAGMRIMAKAILEASGYKTDVAESGEEAVEKYRARMVAGRSFGIVVMDLALPGGISGVEALGELRIIDPEVRVVASSGYLEANAREAAMRTGFAGVLPKPYTADRLAAVVKHALES